MPAPGPVGPGLGPGPVAPLYACGGKIATIVDTTPGSIYGTPGDDVIVASSGQDMIWGFRGNDIICGGGGGDMTFAGDGNDVIYGGDGGDLLGGGPGAARIYGEDGNDTIYANGQYDIDTDIEQLYGGDDHDRLFYDSSSVVSCGAGTDYRHSWNATTDYWNDPGVLCYIAART